MKRSLQLFTLATLFAFGINGAHAGVGFTISAIRGISKGKFLGAAIDGAFAATSIAGGLRRISSGTKLGWGVFWLVLENGDKSEFVIPANVSSEVAEEISNKILLLDSSEVMAIVNVVNSEMSQEDKVNLIASITDLEITE